MYFRDMTPEELFQKTKDLPNTEKQAVIQAFLATVDEDDFTQQVLTWGDEIGEQMERLQLSKAPNSESRFNKDD